MLSIFLLGLVIAVVIFGILGVFINSNTNGKLLSIIISMFSTLGLVMNSIFHHLSCFAKYLIIL